MSEFVRAQNITVVGLHLIAALVHGESGPVIQDGAVISSEENFNNFGPSYAIIQDDEVIRLGNVIAKVSDLIVDPVEREVELGKTFSGLPIFLDLFNDRLSSLSRGEAALPLDTPA